MRVAVTGGSGRLGRSVLEALVNRGHEVTSIDRGTIAGFTGRQVSMDVLEPGALTALLAADTPDAIVHLAAIAVPFSAPESVILDVNSHLAFTVLDAARAAGVGRVLAASSPTVIGYGSPTGWTPDYLPLDESHPVRPWNAYAVSKLLVEELVAMFARQPSSTVFGAFRPCFVVSPDEWAGAPTQQGHTIADRLRDPALAAVSLFNYVDARDAASFIACWVEQAEVADTGRTFFVGADDAMAVEPLADLVPRFLPSAVGQSTGLTGTAPAFTSAAARERFGWHPTRSWRTELAADQRALLSTAQNGST